MKFWLYYWSDNLQGMILQADSNAIEPIALYCILFLNNLVVQKTGEVVLPFHAFITYWWINSDLKITNGSNSDLKLGNAAACKDASSFETQQKQHIECETSYTMNHKKKCVWPARTTISSYCVLKIKDIKNARISTKLHRGKHEELNLDASCIFLMVTLVTSLETRS